MNITRLIVAMIGGGVGGAVGGGAAARLALWHMDRKRRARLNGGAR